PRLVDEQEHPPGVLRLIRRDQAAFARRDVLALLQAKSTDVADRPYRLARLASTKGLGTIFDHRNAAWPAVPHDRRDIARISKQVSDDHGASSPADGPRDRFWRDVAGIRINIGKDRNRALIKYGRERSHIRDGRGDDLIARLRVDRSNGTVDCRAAVRAGA